MKRSPPSLSLLCLFGHVLIACAVNLPVDYTGSTATSRNSLTCDQCIAAKCAKELGACNFVPRCLEASNCVKIAGGDEGKIGACSSVLGAWASSYPETITACALDECETECPATADYSERCGFNWILSYPQQGNTEKWLQCDACLTSNCCEQGLECGRSLDCWDAWSCDYKCTFNDPGCPGSETCKYMPGWQSYIKARDCATQCMDCK